MQNLKRDMLRKGICCGICVEHYGEFIAAISENSFCSYCVSHQRFALELMILNTPNNSTQIPQIIGIWHHPKTKFKKE